MSSRRVMSVRHQVVYQSEVMKDGPILYWRLNETSGQFLDSSGNGRHGNLSGTGVRGAPGIVEGDTAFKGDLSSFVGTPLQSIAGDFTYEFWFSATSLASSSEPNACVAIGHGHNGNYGFYIYLTEGLGGRIQAASFDGAAKETNADGVPLLNGPKHICVTRVGTVVTIYVNGSDVTTTHAVHGATVDPGGLNIYVNQYIAANYSAVATYDEVAVYAKALSLDRIRAHYNARMLKFSPLSLSPFLWLDASDRNTMISPDNVSIAIDNSPVKYLMNKGTAGGSFSQTSSGFEPNVRPAIQNGRSALDFLVNGGMTSALFTPITQYTMFAVYKLNGLPTTGNAFAVIQNGDSSNGGFGIFAYNASGTANATVLHAGVVWQENGPSVLTPEVVMAQRDASSTTMRRNGVAAVLSNQNIVHAGTTYSYMGQGNSSGAYFMETLIFPLLSAADSERVETYLRNKWNIPSIVEDDFSGLGVLNGSYPPIRHAGNPWLNLDGLPSSQNRVGGYAQLDTQPTAYRATIDCGASDGTLEMTFKHSSSGGSNTIVIWRVSSSPARWPSIAWWAMRPPPSGPSPDWWRTPGTR
jgi:hypothetical protein